MGGRTDVRTDVHDVMAIKPNFLTSVAYHIFLAMVLRARAKGARGSSAIIIIIIIIIVIIIVIIIIIIIIVIIIIIMAVDMDECYSSWMI